MTDYEQGRSGGEGSPPDLGALPYHAGRSPGAPAPLPPLLTPPADPPPGGPTPGGPTPGFGTPLSAPPPVTVPPPRLGAAGERPAAADGVPGRITIDDEVIEKIALLAAQEIAGVIAVEGRAGSGGAAAGERRAPVRVRTHDDQVSLDLALTVEYGSVVLDVATIVRANVARVVGRMLGMRVEAVNVAVEDVRLPGSPA
ncbi:Asp23/Gls24 family envelope stress response protein [Actinomadura flavalba]|uniref:Asp23/Gls24 family envelope stress response protein n=1 Tax=Actinomadura flavalba TaxID=1120938 RepID=UPI0003677892|nr:Asp23/Gls24 family envelope stress response protein [Actinomadura flavalba]